MPQGQRQGSVKQEAVYTSLRQKGSGQPGVKGRESKAAAEGKLQKARVDRVTLQKAGSQQEALRETRPELPPTPFLWKNTVAGKVDIRSRQVSNQRQGPLAVCPWGLCSGINKDIRLGVTEGWTCSTPVTLA